MATAREFLILIRLKNEKEKEVFSYLSRIEKSLKEQRFTVKRAENEVRIQEFLEMIAPSLIKFNTDHFICGNTFRCVWALREYQTCY